MKNFIHLLTKNNKKSIILFITLNILLVFVETFSIASIPLIIDFAISNNPILPQYFKVFENFLNDFDKKNILLYGSFFPYNSFYSKKYLCNFFGCFSGQFIQKF